MVHFDHILESSFSFSVFIVGLVELLIWDKLVSFMLICPLAEFNVLRLAPLLGILEPHVLDTNVFHAILLVGESNLTNLASMFFYFQMHCFDVLSQVSL